MISLLSPGYVFSSYMICNFSLQCLVLMIQTDFYSPAKTTPSGTMPNLPYKPEDQMDIVKEKSYMQLCAAQTALDDDSTTFILLHRLSYLCSVAPALLLLSSVQAFSSLSL